MIVIADLHLGKTNDSILVDGVLSQTKDIQTRLNFILARAKVAKTCIAIAGDVFNRVNPTTQVMAVFFTWLRDCNRNGVSVYIIAGNHDAGVDWSSASMLEAADLGNVTVVTRPSTVDVTEGGYTRSILFFPHVPTTVQELAESGHGSLSRWASLEDPDAEFVITHGMIDDQDYSNDIFFEAGNAMRIEPAEFKNLKLMVLGHIHGHMFGKNWVYPGSLTINNFGEVDERKGWVDVDLCSLSYLWHEFPDDVTPWVHVELDLTDKDETSLDESSVEKIASGAILKVTVLAKAHGIVNESYIRKLFGTYGYVTRFETKVTDDVTRVTVSPENRLAHDKLLENYISTLDAPDTEKKLAIKLGRKIIADELSLGGAL